MTAIQKHQIFRGPHLWARGAAYGMKPLGVTVTQGIPSLARADRARSNSLHHQPVQQSLGWGTV